MQVRCRFLQGLFDLIGINETMLYICIMEKVYKKPLFPLLEVYKDNYFVIIEDEEILKRCKASFLLSQHKYKGCCFDAEGNKWEYERQSKSYRSTVLKTILSNLGLFNPWIVTIPVFTQKGTYGIDALKQILKKCVDADDDVITQFAEADIINRAIEKASDFNEILAVFEKYIFNPDEEEIWKEHEEAGYKE